MAGPERSPEELYPHFTPGDITRMRLALGLVPGDYFGADALVVVAKAEAVLRAEWERIQSERKRLGWVWPGSSALPGGDP